MRRIGLAVLLVAAATTAYADSILTLTPVTVFHQYQQTSNSPCVIGNPSCNNPGGFTFTNLIPLPDYTNVSSPIYTVSQIQAIAGSSIIVGYDVNQTNVNQTLSTFTMQIYTTNNGGVLSGLVDTDTYTAPPSPGDQVPPTVGGGNGNGYADYLLTGFTNLSAFSNDYVLFKMTMPVFNDGAEQFFLINGAAPPPPPSVPEPSTIALLGSGLIGAAGLLRMRRAIG